MDVAYFETPRQDEVQFLASNKSHVIIKIAYETDWFQAKVKRKKTKDSDWGRILSFDFNQKTQAYLMEPNIHQSYTPFQNDLLGAVT